MYGYSQAGELLGSRLSDMMPRSDPQNVAYLRALGIGATRCTAGNAWRALLDACARDATLAGVWWRAPLDVIIEHGPLARRILRATGACPSRRKLHDVYSTLCDCLRDGRMFA